MTWTETASAHLDNPKGERHRMVLLSPRELFCWDCTTKLILPRDPSGPTPSPAPFRRLDRPGVPMPAGFKERIAAEIRARKAAVEDSE